VAFIIQNDVTTSRAIPQKTSLAGRTNGISSRLFCMGDRRDSSRSSGESDATKTSLKKKAAIVVSIAAERQILLGDELRQRRMHVSK
jgi:hypothetical protein